MPKTINSVITLKDIKDKAQGHMVEIPDWEPGKTITVRLRSIDITPLIMELGSIPNGLSAEVTTMFEGDSDDKDKGSSKDAPPADTKNRIAEFTPILDKLCEQALAEPTYEEINEIYPLNLQQKMAIFEHVTGGIEKLKPFRT